MGTDPKFNTAVDRVERMTNTGQGGGDASDGADSVGEPIRTESDPYEGEDISTYPDWWRENVELFRKHDLPHYRPPRFTDGEYTTPWVKVLQEELDVDIRFQCIDPQSDGTWTLVVDGESAATVDRSRAREGYTEYGITSGEFKRLVCEAVDDEPS